MNQTQELIQVLKRAGENKAKSPKITLDISIVFTICEIASCLTNA